MARTMVSMLRKAAAPLTSRAVVVQLSFDWTAVLSGRRHLFLHRLAQCASAAAPDAGFASSNVSGSATKKHAAISNSTSL
jgi:hypothetical protein